MLLWAVIHSIYEEAIGDAYPVVQHVMFGRTLEEAQGYFKSHMKTDTFLRGCHTRGRWDGVHCHTAVATMRYDTATKKFSEP